MNRTPTRVMPPRVARAIVSLASEPADRPWVLADLDEEFRSLATSDAGRARRWYWRQAATSLLPLVRRRMRRRPPSVTPGRPEMLNGMRTDLRHALRTAVRTPIPTAAIVLTMALGIGATAAVSTVVWKVLLQPLPIREADRVLAVYRVLEQTGTVIRSVSYPDLNDWRERTKSFLGIAPYTGGEATLLTEQGPVSVNAVQVGEDFFTVLGSRFALGRAFAREAFTTGAAPVVILSGTMWEREFRRDPSIIGRSIQLATGPATVVGVVAPGEFTLPLGGADLWMPLQVATTGPTSWTSSRATQWLEAVARVRSDVPVSVAMGELASVDAAVQREFPRPSNGRSVIGVRPLQEFITGSVRTTLLFLAGSVVIVLLVVCTNIANLRLGQAHARGREFAMRLVLGAGFGRLRRQVLTESMMLSVSGAVVGLLLARPILRGLLELYPGTLPRADEIQLSPAVIGWSFLVAILAGVLFAVPQMLHVVRINAGRVAKENERGTTTRGHHVARRAMVVVQLALSVVMLVSSGLLVRTFLQVTRVSPGFDSRGVVSFALSASASRYPTLQATEQLFDAVNDRLRALPGVQAVSETNALPLTFNPWRNDVPRPNAHPSEPAIPVNMRLVSAGHLEMLRVQLKRGRLIDNTDNSSSPSVVVINESLAALLFPGQDPIGKTISGAGGEFGRRIVGVVGDVHHTSLTAPPDNELYLPMRQAGVRRSRVVAIRAEGDLSRFGEMIAREIRLVDPELPVRNVRTLEEIMAQAVAPQQFRAAFIGSLAVLALALAVVGVYGVMSYTVSERSRELGIRVALGEMPSRLRLRVISEALTLAALGSAVGAAGAWAATRALRSLMFEVGAGDPLTLATVAVTLTLVTIVAADGPARRAGRIDPIAAIRGD